MLFKYFCYNVNMQRRKYKLLGYDIDLFSMSEAMDYVNSLIDSSMSSHIITINPEIIEYANKHEDFAKILNDDNINEAKCHDSAK